MRSLAVQTFARRPTVASGLAFKSSPGGAYFAMLLGLAAVGLAIVATVADVAARREAWLHNPYRPMLDRCAERGGAVTRGPFGETYCRVAYADGGRACTDSGQCKGACLIVEQDAPKGSAVGACQAANVQFGCIYLVKQGRATGFHCID